MNDIERAAARAAFRTFVGRERGRSNTTQAVLGDGNGTLNVPGRPGWYYARLRGDPDSVLEVRSTTCPIINGLWVDLEYLGLGGGYRVIGLSAYSRNSYQQFLSSGITGVVGQHALQHQRRDNGTGGFDPLDIYTRALVPLRVIPTSPASFAVYAEPGYYYINGFRYWAGGTSAAMTPPVGSVIVPTSRYDLVYVGNDDQLHIATGVPVYDGVPAVPVLPANSLPLAFVLLSSGDSEIGETAITDARVILTASTSPTGGTAPADAPYVIMQPHSALSSGVVLSSGVIMRGGIASLPTAGVPGRVYASSDAGSNSLLRDSGAGWDEIAALNVTHTGVIVGSRRTLNFANPATVSVVEVPEDNHLNVTFTPVVISNTEPASVAPGLIWVDTSLV